MEGEWEATDQGAHSNRAESSTCALEWPSVTPSNIPSGCSSAMSKESRLPARLTRTCSSTQPSLLCVNRHRRIHTILYQRFGHEADAGSDLPQFIGT